jgi:hypothetical protein
MLAALQQRNTVDRPTEQHTLFSYCSMYCAVGSSVSVRGDIAELQHSCALTNNEPEHKFNTSW